MLLFKKSNKKIAEYELQKLNLDFTQKGGTLY